MDVRTIADRISTLARTLGIPPASLGRERFKALAYEEIEGEHAGLSWASWNAAKALASQGSAVNPPVEAHPPEHEIKGVSTLVDADGTVRGQWIKTRAKALPPEEIAARILARLPDRITPRTKAVRAPKVVDTDLLAVYPLGDPHVGMLAWGRESGDDWDLDIAERTIVGAVQDLVRRGPRAAKALIVNLGDLFHADNAHNHTTGGTHTLDVDSRMSKVQMTGMRILTALVDAALAHHRSVELDMVAGNHDAYTAIVMAIALAAWYRNEPRVVVPVNPAARHYHRFGQCLIGTVHGDRAKGRDLAEIMASERPEEWGGTRHRAWLVGHVHHSSVQEHRGVRVETFRTLAARDAWHAGQGYVAGRDLHRIVYHRTWGEVSREICGLDYLRAVR